MSPAKKGISPYSAGLLIYHTNIIFANAEIRISL